LLLLLLLLKLHEFQISHHLSVPFFLPSSSSATTTSASHTGLQRLGVASMRLRARARTAALAGRLRPETNAEPLQQHIYR
jgi:hypothetical protein